MKRQILKPVKNNEFNEDLLSAKELGEIEGGFCDYTCIACATSGLF